MTEHTSAYKSVFISTRNCALSKPLQPSEIIEGHDLDDIVYVDERMDYMGPSDYHAADFTVTLNTVSGVNVPREGVTSLKLEEFCVDESHRSLDFVELTPSNTGFLVTFAVHFNAINGPDRPEAVIDLCGFSDTFEVEDGNGLAGFIGPLAFMYPRLIADDDMIMMDDFATFVIGPNDTEDEISIKYSRLNNYIFRINRYLENIRLQGPIKFVKDEITHLPLPNNWTWEDIIYDTLSRLRFRVFHSQKSGLPLPANILPVEEYTRNPAEMIVAHLIDLPGTPTPNYLQILEDDHMYGVGIFPMTFKYNGRIMYPTFSKYIGRHINHDRPVDLYGAFAYRRLQFIAMRTRADCIVEPYRHALGQRIFRLVIVTDASSSDQDFTGKLSWTQTVSDWSNTIAFISVDADGQNMTVRSIPHNLNPGSRLGAFRLMLVNDANEVLYTPNHFHFIMTLTNTSNLHNPTV